VEWGWDAQICVCALQIFYSIDIATRTHKLPSSIIPACQEIGDNVQHEQIYRTKLERDAMTTPRFKRRCCAIPLSSGIVLFLFF
jgi:hypothetical protein